MPDKKLQIAYCPVVSSTLTLLNVFCHIVSAFLAMYMLL